MEGEDGLLVKEVFGKGTPVYIGNESDMNI